MIDDNWQLIIDNCDNWQLIIDDDDKLEEHPLLQISPSPAATRRAIATNPTQFPISLKYKKQYKGKYKEKYKDEYKDKYNDKYKDNRKTSLLHDLYNNKHIKEIVISLAKEMSNYQWFWW